MEYYVGLSCVVLIVGCIALCAAVQCEMKGDVRRKTTDDNRPLYDDGWIQELLHGED